MSNQSSLSDPFQYRDHKEKLTRGEFVAELLSLLELSWEISRKHRDFKMQTKLENAIDIIKKSYSVDELMDLEKLIQETGAQFDASK